MNRKILTRNKDYHPPDKEKKSIIYETKQKQKTMLDVKMKTYTFINILIINISWIKGIDI